MVGAAAPALVAAPMAVVSTRRAPRFLVRDPLNAVIESGSATLIDISVLGAQIVSGPALRPRQKIQIALPDTSDLLHVTAHVAFGPAAVIVDNERTLELVEMISSLVRDLCELRPFGDRRSAEEWLSAQLVNGARDGQGT